MTYKKHSRIFCRTIFWLHRNQKSIAKAGSAGLALLGTLVVLISPEQANAAFGNLINVLTM